jgi:cell division transport system ATP-binding protein
MPFPLRRAAEPAPDFTETARLQGVEFGYGQGARVLRGIDLLLPRGSFHFLTGPSGAGKSSLLRLLHLAARPTAGRMRLFGEDAGLIRRHDAPRFRRRIGVVFQDFRLMDHLSVFDNAALPLRLAGKRPEDYAPDVEEMLRWVGLGGRMGDLPETLSGGEKQRLAIARAVIGKPDLILADEPTGNVDAAMAARLLKLFQGLNQMGATVLIASHDEALAARSGAGVLRLEHGRIHGGAA